MKYTFYLTNRVDLSACEIDLRHENRATSLHFPGGKMMISFIANEFFISAARERISDGGWCWNHDSNLGVDFLKQEFLKQNLEYELKIDDDTCVESRITGLIPIERYKTTLTLLFNALATQLSMTPMPEAFFSELFRICDNYLLSSGFVLSTSMQSTTSTTRFPADLSKIFALREKLVNCFRRSTSFLAIEWLSQKNLSFLQRDFFDCYLSLPSLIKSINLQSLEEICQVNSQLPIAQKWACIGVWSSIEMSISDVKSYLDLLETQLNHVISEWDNPARKFDGSSNELALAIALKTQFKTAHQVITQMMNFKETLVTSIELPNEHPYLYLARSTSALTQKNKQDQVKIATERSEVPRPPELNQVSPGYSHAGLN